MCQTPLMLKERNKLSGDMQPVPCGKCPVCMKKLVSSWSFRLVQEGKEADSALFVTLTYDTDHVPLTRNGFMTLNKSDVQKFFKRLRKHHPAISKPVRYFAVGEYGGQTKRPHYHLIIYNSTHKAIMEAWELDDNSLGGSFFGYDCSEAAIGYTLKYMMKPPKFRIPMHTNDDRQPEFRLMSKGLGDSYLKKA